MVSSLGMGNLLSRRCKMPTFWLEALACAVAAKAAWTLKLVRVR